MLKPKTPDWLHINTRCWVDISRRIHKWETKLQKAFFFSSFNHNIKYYTCLIMVNNEFKYAKLWFMKYWYTRSCFKIFGTNGPEQFTFLLAWQDQNIQNNFDIFIWKHPSTVSAVAEYISYSIVSRSSRSWLLEQFETNVTFFILMDNFQLWKMICLSDWPTNKIQVKGQ